eukprot:6522601-Heterocapsa_arctica.AAC.1
MGGLCQSQVGSARPARSQGPAGRGPRHKAIKGRQADQARTDLPRAAGSREGASQEEELSHQDRGRRASAGGKRRGKQGQLERQRHRSGFPTGDHARR